MGSSSDAPDRPPDARDDDLDLSAVRDLWAVPTNVVDVDESTPEGAALLDRWAGLDTPDQLIPAGLDEGLDDGPTLAEIGSALRARPAAGPAADDPPVASPRGGRTWRPREAALVTVGLLLAGLASGWLVGGGTAASEPVDGGTPQIRIVSTGPAACPMWTAAVSDDGREPPGRGCFVVG